jgi:predicted ATPase/DNA-binding XRE family transcriptional regulator
MGPQTPAVSFSSLLKGYREAAGLTQEALAERAGLSARAISALERGVNRTPRRDTLDRLAAAMALPARKRAQLATAAYPGVDAALLPALDQAAAAAAPPLAVPATPLVGREREVDQVVGLLRRPEVRLVTLTGPGGVGKTRLALQVAEDLRDAFDDGVWLVELAEVRSAEHVPAAVAQALGLRETAGQTMDARLEAYLRGKHLLLVLDNFEHLAPAWPLVARLVATAPRLKVLVTSRAGLHLRAEHEFLVPPLAVPAVGDADRGAPEADGEPIEGYASVALFLQRARAAGASVTLAGATAPVVAEICRRLDGLPLAIELAAPRIRVLPPAALLERLERRLPLLTGGARDLPARQRTMRDAIGWSYELLRPQEQAVFRKLSVCVGGCTLEAAEAIAGEGSALAAHELLDRVAALVDGSLVRVAEDAGGEPRVTMLEVVREYGLEQLGAGSEEAGARERHAHYFLHLAEEAGPHLLGSAQQGSWLARLEREHGNLAAALRWARERGQDALGRRLAGALGPYWYFRGHFSEGRAWIDGFLAATAGAPLAGAAASMRLWLLYGAGKLALEQGDTARVSAVAAEALALAKTLDHALGVAQALELQGSVARLHGDPLGGRALLEQALLWSRRVGDRGQLERVLFGLGQASLEAEIGRAHV